MDWSSVWFFPKELGLQPATVFIIIILIWVWRRFEAMDRRFSRLELGFLGYARGNLEFQRNLIHVLSNEGVLSSGVAVRALESMVSISRKRFEEFLAVQINPLTDPEKPPKEPPEKGSQGV
jgi:hypothetical protein